MIALNLLNYPREIKTPPSASFSEKSHKIDRKLIRTLFSEKFTDVDTDADVERPVFHVIIHYDVKSLLNRSRNDRRL